MEPTQQISPDRSSIEDIIDIVSDYFTEKDKESLREAYTYAEEVYAGLKGIDKKPYISHPLEVCRYLAKLRLDVNTLISGLLHSVYKEPFNIEEKKIEQRFGPDVARLIQGTTRITEVKYNSRLAYQAENVRKLFVAMAADIRVLLVRLCDRLHDMQYAEPNSRRGRELARETMDLYAPLASRLGIDWVKRDLEDLSFSFLHPEEHADLLNKIESSMEERLEFVEDIKAILHGELERHHIKNCRIIGRPKHLYSIYRKLTTQNITFDKVYDKVAFRIIVNTVGECFEVLGVVHSLWSPIASRFKDFISSPKTNMYQSLHTSVVGPHGGFMEIQIRTEEMDRIANDGIAAHWAYKEKRAISHKDAKLFEWLKQLVKGFHEVKDPKELLETVKGELQQEGMYVFTPKGDIKELKVGSTPLDFAYSIHTEVGHHCTGAKINGRIVPLKHQLQNGDVLEILTSPNQWPKRGWLSIVKTSRARSRIRSWLAQEEQKTSLRVGRELCERELRAHNISLKKIIKTGHLKEVLKRLNCNSLEDLLVKVGRGKVTVKSILRTILPPEILEDNGRPTAQEGVKEFIHSSKKKDLGKKSRDDAIVIEGMDNLLTNISQCCMPVPGDEIVGFITAGRGISVHKSNCPNLLHSDSQRWIKVEWASTDSMKHRVQFQIVAQDRKGLLTSLSNAISTMDANILNVEARTNNTNLATFNMVIEVAGKDHLEAVLQQVRKVKEVIEAKRK